MCSLSAIPTGKDKAEQVPALADPCIAKRENHHFDV